MSTPRNRWKSLATRAVGFLAILVLLLTIQPAWANRVTDVSDGWIALDRGSLDGVAIGATLALAPPNAEDPQDANTAAALATIERVGPEVSVARITKQPASGAVEKNWRWRILSQDLKPRPVRVRIITDDTALRTQNSYEGTRGCGGIRVTLRKQKAETATAQVAQAAEEIAKETGAEVIVQEIQATPTPAPTATPTTIPPTPEPTAGKTAEPPSPPPTPLPPPPPVVEQWLPAAVALSSPADMVVKINYSGGKAEGEVWADILLISPGGETLERVTVLSEQVPEKTRELLAKHTRAETSRQTVLNLHNPQPGFEIELWLNAPGGPSAASTSQIALEGMGRSISVGAGEAASFTVPAGRTALLCRGQEMSFGFRASRDCYLVLYNVGPAGDVNQLFPNPFLRDNRIRADVTYTLPPADFRTPDGKRVFFHVDREKPVGMEIVKAIATLDPIALTQADLEEIEKEGFPSATPAPPGARWDLASNSLANRIALTRSITLGTAQDTAQPTPPPAAAATIQEIQTYLRDLAKWSDVMITFFTAEGPPCPPLQ